jgi:hypothetical protein
VPGGPTTVRIAASAALLTLCLGCFPDRADSVAPAPGISRLVESRDGCKSCWGVVISLPETRLKDRIGPEDLSVVDEKYGRESKALMVWDVSAGGRVLTIRFKPGMGDFGSGNAVTVSLRPSAFQGTSAPAATVRFHISTDLP